LRDELEARERLISALATTSKVQFPRTRGANPAIEYISSGIKKIIGIEASALLGAPCRDPHVRHPTTCPPIAKPSPLQFESADL